MTSDPLRLATVDEAVEALRLGRPVLVADNADRENEVDVIIAAQLATTEWLAWCIRHSSGYLCAPLPSEWADKLALPLMVTENQDPRGTAYTVSTDAAVGVTTGISAADRARTLRTLANPDSTAGDLIRPGHILPLRARPGGVLERPGHTEAAVDLCRVAGLNPVAAIGELVNDNGSMMRLPEASMLAAKEGLPLLTIAALVEWRQQHEGTECADPDSSLRPPVRRVAEAELPTLFGDFRVLAYKDMTTGAEHLALISKNGLATAPAVRVHSECLTGDALASLRCDCGPQLRYALEYAAQHQGVVIYLRGHEGRGIGLASKIAAYALQDEGLDTVDANVKLGHPVDSRDYSAAAYILRELGIDSIRLLTNNPDKVACLAERGITVVERQEIEVGRTAQNQDYLSTKASRMGHLLSDGDQHAYRHDHGAAL